MKTFHMLLLFSNLDKMRTGQGDNEGMWKFHEIKEQ